jgi:hypothetical protein
MPKIVADHGLEEIPNHKLQITNKSQYPITKTFPGFDCIAKPIFARAWALGTVVFESMV